MIRSAWRPALVAAGLLLFGAAAPAQDNPPPQSAAFLEGTEAFRRIIYDAGKDISKDGVTPLQSFDELDDPKHTLLIVFGDSSSLMKVPGGVENFVRRGGALFLATDQAMSPRVAAAVGRLTGYVVNGKKFTGGDPDRCYRGLAECPFLNGLTWLDAEDLFRNLATDQGISTVATNVPSYLDEDQEHGGTKLPLLASMEGKSFGVGGDVGDEGGRVLLLADHSIFINEMIMQPDNGNLDFSYNCLKWLTSGKQSRTRVLFVEDGKINSKFDVPLKDVPDGLMDKLTNYVLGHLGELAHDGTPKLERKLQEFDEQNGFNRKLLTWFRVNHIAPYGILNFLAVLLAVLVVLYGCWRIGWKGRYRPDMQGPLLATVLNRAAPSGTMTEQRRLALICGGNLWEPARDLARQCLAASGATACAAPPVVAVRGGWPRRWAMAGRIRRLWRLAYGSPVRVPLGEWRRLLREVEDMKAAFADGTVQWV